MFNVIALPVPKVVLSDKSTLDVVQCSGTGKFFVDHCSESMGSCGVLGGFFDGRGQAEAALNAYARAAQRAGRLTAAAIAEARAEIEVAQ